MLENYQFEEELESSQKNLPDEELWLNKKKKIMIIDDDMDFRLSVSEILVENGFSVTTAKDGEIALNQLLHDPNLPDLILVDLLMPVKGGLEFRREQSKIAELSDIPVVFVTGEGLVDGELCLQKPFTEEEFINLLKKYV
jgi:CheY-like chemotaxis protein